MTDEKVKEEFEKWLRSYCFQAPPERDYLLMKDTWAECSRTSERLAKIEVLEMVLDCSERRMTRAYVENLLDILKAGR